jgi:hypothetical protein
MHFGRGGDDDGGNGGGGGIRRWHSERPLSLCIASRRYRGQPGRCRASLAKEAKKKKEEKEEKKKKKEEEQKEEEEVSTKGRAVLPRKEVAPPP